MMSWTGIAFFIQLFFGISDWFVFLNLLKGQRTQKVSIDRDSKKEMDQLRTMRQIRLTEPLAEKVRPITFQGHCRARRWH